MIVNASETGIVSASASARGFVQRRPRRILAGDPRPLDHLFGLQQKVDQLVGGVRLIAVRIDGQCRAAERGGRGASRAVRHRGRGEPSGDARLRPVLHQRVGIGPVPHEDGLAVLKREPRLLLLPGEHGRRHDAVDVDGVAHGGQRLLRRVGINDDLPAIVEDRAAEAAQVLEEDRHQPFVAGALPDQPERHPVFGLRASRQLHEIAEVAWGTRHQVGSPVQHADVDEPRQGVQRAVPAIGRDGGGKEPIDGRMIPIEAGNPPGRRELRRPHDVELQDVGIARPRVEPLDIELMPLVRRIGRRPQRHRDRRMRPPEAFELAADDVGFPSDHAAGEGEHRLTGPDAASRSGRHTDRQHRRHPPANLHHLLAFNGSADDSLVSPPAVDKSAR